VQQRATDLVGDEGDGRPALASTQPAASAVQVMAAPTAIDAPAAMAPLTTMLARAPSDARSSTHSVPSLAASTATTVNIAPADSRPTGAATDTATGSIDSALSSDAPLPCAAAGSAGAASAAASSRDRMRCFMVCSLLTLDITRARRPWPRARRAASWPA
jgi:hypothetical protein